MFETVPEWSDEDLAAAAACAPDTLDLAVEAADMMAVFAAQRYRQLDRLHREAVADAERRGSKASLMVGRSVRLEVAAALRITEHAAEQLLCQARALVHDYPTVLESLSRAGITEKHADVLVQTVSVVSDDALRQSLVPQALELAESLAVGSFRRAVRRLVDTAEAATLSERHERALKERHISVEEGRDGMGWLQLHAPMVEIRAVQDRATSIAKVLIAHEGETRSLDQARADVICDLLIDGMPGSLPPEARGIRAEVVVTVPALSLLDDGAATEAEPASLEGTGPIPIERARELCGGGKQWMRILTHPETGMVLSVGRDRYDPPPQLKRLARWRAERCMAPGCGMPASRCEIDHNLAFREGGETRLTNLCPFCKGHHDVKHHGGWCVSQLDGSGGAIEWISPTGRRYVVQPERAVPVFTPAPAGSEHPPPF